MCGPVCGNNPRERISRPYPSFRIDTAAGNDQSAGSETQREEFACFAAQFSEPSSAGIGGVTGGQAGISVAVAAT